MAPIEQLPHDYENQEDYMFQISPLYRMEDNKDNIHSNG